MFLAWFTFEGLDDLFELYGADLGVDDSVNLFQSTGFWDIVILVATVAALVAVGMALATVNKGGSMGERLKVNAFFLPAAAAVVNLLSALILMLDNKEDGIGLGIGFFLFAVVNVALVALNGPLALKNKDKVMGMMNQVKADAQKNVNNMQKPSEPEAPKAM
jgi:uncharacterized protein YacL